MFFEKTLNNQNYQKLSTIFEKNQRKSNAFFRFEMKI
jgi:hypothetical protein